MRLPSNEIVRRARAQQLRQRTVLRGLGNLSWARALSLVVCVASAHAAACSSSDDTSAVGDDDTDVDVEEVASEPEKDASRGASTRDRDGAAKPDATATEPSTVKPTTADAAVRSDAGARIDSGAGTPAPAQGDAALVSADAGSPPSGPLILPTSDQPGPYEVVVLENVGKGFENPPTAANDRGTGEGCTSFVESFGETPEAAREYALFGPNYKVDLYTLYYPKNMAEGQRYPILSWANGTCAKTNGYNALLKHLASHGFIVVATNSRYTASGKFQLRGVDFVTAEDTNAMSPLFGKVDTKRVGLFGHSQGGGSTWTAASDARVKTSVVLNMVASGTRPTPTFFVTGDKDLFPVSSALNAARAQKVGAALALHKIEGRSPAGHITLMKEPERVYPAVTAWFRYQLLADEEGKSWFVGDACRLCNKPDEWDFVAKGLD